MSSHITNPRPDDPLNKPSPDPERAKEEAAVHPPGTNNGFTDLNSGSLAAAVLNGILPGPVNKPEKVPAKGSDTSS